MKNNKILQILTSLPIILLALYFIPFLGICLILLRFFISNDVKKDCTIIVITGLLLLLPKLIQFIMGIINFDINAIPYLSDIINSDIYNINFLRYSKYLITVGIITLIISIIVKSVTDKLKSKLTSGISNYISETQKRDAEISRKNDLEIKLKQERAKNTNYVRCPHCGSDNIISEKTAVCSFCRRNIVNEQYK